MNASILHIPQDTPLYPATTKIELTKYSKFKYFQKRVIDFLFSALLIFVSFPIIALIIVRIKKESPGPIFFKQSRIGINGEKFTCYKFRSMHIHTHTEEGKYTKEEDLRIFPFGQFMRKTRIDELPQIINILKGEMHLVGPRAEWDILSNQYRIEIKNYNQRYLVKPGITGLAQVSYPYGRNIYDAEQKLTHDLQYIKDWSLSLEIKILVKTVGVVLGKKGI